MKKFLNIVMWVLLIAGLSGMVGFVEIEQKNVKCIGIDINIQRKDTGIFISDKEVSRLIQNLSDDTVIGRPVKELSIEKIRATLRTNPYAAKVTVYITVDGRLKVDILQRTPIIRVINDKDMSFYISEDGVVVPVSELSVSRVPVVTGNISAPFVPGASLRTAITDSSDMAGSMSLLQQIFVLGEYLNQDAFFRAELDQIYVNQSGDFEFVPKTGNQIILFGDVNDISDKFANLLAFYKYGMKQAGWSHYRTINIKYKNQVICSKT